MNLPLSRSTDVFRRPAKNLVPLIGWAGSGGGQGRDQVDRVGRGRWAARASLPWSALASSSCERASLTGMG